MSDSGNQENAADFAGWWIDNLSAEFGGIDMNVQRMAYSAAERAWHAARSAALHEAKSEPLSAPQAEERELEKQDKEMSDGLQRKAVENGH